MYRIQILLLRIIVLITAIGYSTVISNAKISILNLTSGDININNKRCGITRSLSYNDRSVSIEYDIPATILSNNRIKEYPEWHIDGFQNIMGDGLPSLPIRADLFYIPSGSQITLKIDELEYVDCHAIIPPTIPLLTDSEPNLKTIIPIKDYDGFYPQKPVEISRIRQQTGYDIVSVNVSPLLYNNKDELVRIYKRINYSIEATSNELISHKTANLTYRDSIIDVAKENHFIEMGVIPIINPEKRTIQTTVNENNLNTAVSQALPRYLILTTYSYKTQAEKLRAWKNALGFNVKVNYSNAWTIDKIHNSIQNFINSSSNSINYCLILGNTSDVPTITKNEVVAGKNFIWKTDLPYFCKNDNDKLPEIKFGRIPINTPEEAEIVISKIIEYERNPPQNEHFYSTIHLNTVFEDNGDENPDETENGYEDRRFCQTTQEIYDYLTKKCNKSIDRVYYYHLEDGLFEIGRTNWSTIFSNGEPIPTELRMENFDWFKLPNGKSELLKGYNLIAFRGHGNQEGWINSSFNYRTFRDAKNGALLPFILSICCDTGFDGGKYMPHSALCNSEGGGIGMIASSYLSFSGPNELLSHGFIDALWPNPGLATSMSYNYPQDNWECLPYEPANEAPIYEAFDAFQKALYRMESVFPTIPEVTDYTRETYCLYGDPSMYLYTDNPYSKKFGKISCDINRTESTVDVYNIKSKGVVTFYDTYTGEIKRYIGATSISYQCKYPQKTIVTIREPNRPLFYDKGSEVTTNY